MEKVDKELVIIGSNEYCEQHGQYFFRSGLEPQMDDLARFFTKMYHYSPKSMHTFVGGEFSKDVVIRPFSVGHHETHGELLRRILEYWKSMKKIYAAHPGALFMVYFPDSYIGMLAALYLKAKRVRCVVRITSNQMEEMRVRGGKWYRRILYVLIRPFYYFFVKQILRNQVQIYSGKKLFFSDDACYSVNSSNLRVSDIHRRRAVEKEAYTLYYVGRFDCYKGLAHAIEAMAYIIAQVRLRIIGFGNADDTQRILDQIKASPVAAAIEMVGQVPYGPALFAAYDEADIVLVPSLYETQGKTYLEAMARGALVVASRTGGIPYIVHDHENGLLVPPGDAQAIAAAVDRLLADRVLQKKMRDSGYQTARGSTIEKITDTTLQAIKKHLL